jgi:uncharacterized cupredoxin-like copper-binding protein
VNKILVASVIAAAAAALPAAEASPAATTRVSVTAGKPSEFRFTLSKHSVRHGTVLFTIRDAGAITHDFKLCSAPRKNAAVNTCNGKGSRKLNRGQSTTLRVTLTKKGTYEYLCTVPGHAAAGMKGLLRVT